ncbi:MAG TPA: penicillin-binding transpeptidase domain-containing protein [Geobacteraceae bacterium]|nr:penicillin-binding transpeptidase domain-containing protein [Geobacteraceae bacterium]
MQDLKHLLKRKRPYRSPFAGLGNRNTLKVNKKLVETEPGRRKLRVLLPLIAVVLGAYPTANLLVSARNAQSSIGASPAPAEPKAKALRTQDNGQGFQMAADLLPAAHFDGGHLSARLADGGTLIYSIDQELQERVEKVLRDSRVPYGVFVAIEPKTGRVLAMIAHSDVNPAWERNSFYNLYPMASLFKIVTAAAALEQKKVGPDTVFAFRGKNTSENPRYWYVKPGRHNQEMPLDVALGKSVNPVFGRLASDVVGRDGIVSFAERFGFNQVLMPGTSLKASCAVTPQNDSELKLMGAGLCHEVKISPLHAATMMAAIANEGVMMSPELAQEIRNGKGETIFTRQSRPLRTLVSPATAGQLSRMLATSVNSGTSRKAFHDRRGRARLASLDIAAKTGTINGKDPAGHYSWFAAYAPAKDPQIALAALVINGDKWRIKASYVGEQALEAFFK